MKTELKKLHVNTQNVKVEAGCFPGGIYKYTFSIITEEEIDYRNIKFFIEKSQPETMNECINLYSLEEKDIVDILNKHHG